MSLFEDLFADLTQPVDLNEFEDLPRLDFDTSTLTSSALSLDPAASAPPCMESLSMDLTVDSAMNDYQVPVSTKSADDSEEIKRMLTDISSRLTDLESAVSAGNAQLNQLGFNLDIAMPRITGMADEFRGAIEGLKESIKDFARGLINHLVNCRIEGDVESRRTT
ncbi:hypothetical protein FSARC_11370 [Fusarium sarcochroum]|uniref:Uncharacterized protein n=1 Tax=Fusarium sarcochroum TaxID=1208366 RepID=A0A8H4TG40_9HYPO|nr:hypothetical protein FSARC_11370 [Fusarium sarcochroum]